MTAKILCTGWYCDESRRDYKAEGDDSIRGLGFRPLWWESINRFARPELVFVVDSASPKVPDDRAFADARVEHLRLRVNPGHAQNTSYHYCGWTASVIHGLEYVLASDADYMLYVEQDALIFGDHFIDRIEASLLENKYVFGSNEDTMWPLQQSLFAIRKDGIRPFLAGLHGLSQPDSLMSPEVKFALAVERPESINYLLRKAHSARIPRGVRERLLPRIYQRLGGFAFLPFGYGRTRPIDFGDECFYFQHGSAAEITAYQKKIGWTGPGQGDAGSL